MVIFNSYVSLPEGILWYSAVHSEMAGILRMFIPTIPMVFLANVYSMQQNDQRSKALSGHSSWTPHLGCGFDHLAFLLMSTVTMDFRVVQWMVGF